MHLSDDFYLIPLTQATKGALDDDPEPPGFLELSPSMVAAAEHLSHLGPVTYCHMEFFGGTCFQAAVAWTGGQIQCGPVFTANHPAERQSEEYRVVGGRHRIRDMAINVVLRHVGVTIGDSLHEFQAIGLDRHRWTEDWIG